MKSARVLIGILITLLSVATALADKNDITFASKAEVEVQEVNAQGEDTWVRKPPTLVIPGTVVIYTNTFTNNGAEPASDLIVTNPVPENMVYVAGSALGENAEITFSADGGNSFAPEDQLQVTEADGTQRPAAPKEITHVRWQVLKPLPPAGSGQVEFRARLL